MGRDHQAEAGGTAGPAAPARRAAVRVAAACGIAVAAVAVYAAAASAQAAITVSPTTAAGGETVTVTGNVPVAGDGACAPGSVRLTSTSAFFPPDGFGPEAPRDGEGDFQATYVVPADTPPGSYRIGVRCGGGNVGIATSLEVTAAGGTTTETAPTTATTATTAPPEPSTTPGGGVTTAPTTPTTAGTAPTTSDPAAPDDDSDNTALWIGLVVLVLALGAGGVAYALRRRRAGGDHLDDHGDERHDRPDDPPR